MHACIDLGSNSFHLLIGEWKQGRIQILERFSEKVQLGENVRGTGEISPAAFARGMSCLHRFKLLMQSYPLEQYWALGTNTFRVTRNAAEFVEAARERIGIDISIITGVQEAELIYAGVLTSLPLSNLNRLVIDVGGGSTEIIIGSNHERLFTESLAIGSVAWRDRYFSDQSVGKTMLQAQMEAGQAEARKVFASVASGINRVTWQEAYGSSGTMKMLANICTGQGYGNGVIQLRALHDLKKKFVSVIAKGRILPGLKESRRDLLLPGWCVLVGLMESHDVEEIRFSSTALREGMLDFMVKNKKTMKAMKSSNLPDVVSTKE